eukprot:GEMP01007323.1.p1 GENE.GEMP01007323.1~~GEMP01007323.1.p1  ORF type:complete len:836 (+),score=241.27 GEMP01007323.1:655-3162(+)
MRRSVFAASPPSASINALLGARRWQQALSLVLTSSPSSPSSLSAVPIHPHPPRAIAKVLHACARKNQWAHCLALLTDCMPFDQCRTIDVNVTLSALSRVAAWQHALRVYARFSPSLTDTSSLNATLHALATAPTNEWRRTLHVFTHGTNHEKQSVVRDVLSFNVMMGARGLPWQRALALLRELEDTSTTPIQPTIVSYNVALHALIRGDQWVHALNLLRNMKLNADVVSVATVISGIPSWETALSVLQSYDGRVVLGTGVTWSRAVNAALHVCAKHGHWAQALALLASVEEKNRDIVSYNTTLSAIAASRANRGQAWMHALQLYRDMNDQRLAPTVVTYGSLIAVMEKSRQWRTAWSLFQHMHRESGNSTGNHSSIGANVVVCNNMLSALEKGNQWQHALRLLRVMSNGAVSRDDLRESNELRAPGGDATMRVKPDVISFSAVLSAMERSGEWEQALKVLHAMHHQRVTPNVITYNAVLSALARGVLVAEHRGTGHNASIKDDLRVTDQDQCNGPHAPSLPPGQRRCEINSCDNARSNVEVSCGLARQAMWVLAEMRRIGIEADVITYNAALAACGMDDWARVWNVWRQMRKYSKVEPDALTYVVAIRGMAACGSADQFRSIVDDAHQTATEWAHGNKRDFAKNPYDVVRLLQTLNYDRSGIFAAKVRELVFDRTVNALRDGDVEALEEFGLPNLGPLTRDALDALDLKDFDATAARKKIAALGTSEADGVRARDVVVHLRCTLRTRAVTERIVRFGHVPPAAASSDVLPSVYLNHDRSLHAERRALSQIVGIDGMVELYVTHRPCISCIAAMVGFQKRSPRATLKVAFDNFDCE